MTVSWKQLYKYSLNKKNTTSLSDRQEKWLLECVKRNVQTDYSSLYSFNEINNVSDFQRLVPIVSYEDLSHLIINTSNGQSDCLFSGNPIAFERTSGSTSGQKLIPYSTESIDDFRHALLPWLGSLAQHYKIQSGKAYWAISPATRQPEKTASGIPIGLPDAAYLGEELIPFFLESSVVPPWVAIVSDISEWQLATLYYLVSCHDLQLISVWSPTFFLMLMDAIEGRRAELEKLLKQGGEVAGHTLREQPQAYERLCEYFRSQKTTSLWPELKVISCWADASSKSYANQIKNIFQDVPIQPKGLLLTEGVVTTPNTNGQLLLTADCGFYEFMGVDNAIKLAHELTVGETYEVIITTSGGFYRYRTNDCVSCDGYNDSTPVLSFIGRSSTSDLVGEKLTESFVATCLGDIEGFKMLVPVEDSPTGYLLVLEGGENLSSFITTVESRLKKNPHYEYARKVGQLQPLKALPLKNPLDIYVNSPLHEGTRLGDIKVPSLCLKPEIFNDFRSTIA